jgi:hypothetical protein
VLAVVALALTFASSSLLALRACGGSVGTLAVGTYVVWVAQIVVLSMALSLVDGLGRPGYLAAAAVVCAAAVLLQVVRPAAAPGVAASVRGHLDELRRDRVLLLLALLVAMEIAYATAIALATAPADDDSLQYHLARPAFWLQQGSLGTFGEVADFRLNAFPPNAELVYAFLLSIWDGERIVATVNLLAALALTLSVAVGSRRLGLGRRESLFGALLAATLPVVALQAPSTLTDLQVAALVGCGAALLLRPAAGDLVLGSAALAVALGAKVTGVFAVPVLAAIAWATWRPAWRRALAVIGLGLIAGAYWYGWNTLREGRPLGETSGDQHAERDVVVALGQAMRMTLNAFDLPGAVGHDVFVYPVAAAVLAAAAAIAFVGTRARERSRDLLLAALLVALVPLLAPLGALGQRAYRKLWAVAGQPELVLVDLDRVETFASSMQSGAGPVGLLLLAIGTVLTAREVAGGRLRRIALGFALAPLLWIAMIAATVAYFRWNARFTLAGFALAAMTWGLALRVRWLAAGLAATAAVTLLLSYTHFYEKPAGIRLLEPRVARSAFTTPRPETMAWDPRVVPLLRFLEYELPSDASVAVFPVFYPRRPGMPPDTAPELLAYTAFGASVDRRVALALDPATALRSQADWYLIPSDRIGRCVPGWRTVTTRSSWTVLRRAPEHACG